MSVEQNVSSRPNVCRVTLREINGDPLQPGWIETTVRGDTPEEVWKQIHEFEENGYAVWSLQGESSR